jgi:predicted CoA-binding protein
MMQEAEILNAVRQAQTVAVVGMQDQANADRPAYQIPAQLQRRGYALFPVNPKIRESLGIASLSTVAELEFAPDILDVFRSAEHIPALVDEVLALPEDQRPKLVWLQSGITHPDSEARLEAAGIHVVADKCLGVYAARTSR